MFSESAALVVVQALSLFLQCLGLAAVLAVRRCLSANTGSRMVRSMSRGPAGPHSGSVQRVSRTRDPRNASRNFGRKVSDGVPNAPEVLPSQLQDEPPEQGALWQPPASRP